MAGSTPARRPIRLLTDVDGVPIMGSQLSHALEEAISRLPWPAEPGDRSSKRLFSKDQQRRFLEMVLPYIQLKQLDLQTRPVDAKKVRTLLRKLERHGKALQILLADISAEGDQHPSSEHYQVSALLAKQYAVARGKAGDNHPPLGVDIPRARESIRRLGGAATNALKSPELSSSGGKPDMAGYQLVLAAVIAYREITGNLPKRTRNNSFHGVAVAALALAGVKDADAFKWILEAVDHCQGDKFTSQIIE